MAAVLAAFKLGRVRLHLSHSSVSEIERAKKLQTLEAFGASRFNYAPFWEHTDERIVQYKKEEEAKHRKALLAKQERMEREQRNDLVESKKPSF